MPERIALLSVNVGAREVIDVWPGRGDRGQDKPIESGIRKRPVGRSMVAVGPLGIEGDVQADRRRIRGVQIHGGPGKAVYAYPSEHFSDWSDALDQEIGPGAFGENLTIRGATEERVFIGDVWRWGEALLQVSEPRGPCYKLDIHRGDSRTGKLMNAWGRTGWYLRVLEPGQASTSASIALERREAANVSVLDVHRAWNGRDDAALERLLDLEPLGADLRQMIRNRLRRRRARPS